ncbi:2-acylglycerophosphoethanolamine acyltransferase [Rhodovulum sp. P5]|uniref:AMP-binding protein n=1 Tax=Rhodovulum sp. P5 TaxID=1564506 RepID=UPI0009C33E95|nr:AMP-binding protein [Rhodovulum sp. P5]ARE42121.1 2-acylglycerophosphoethanolamine acyltransferase [Rhodovulum sp. P5]
MTYLKRIRRHGVKLGGALAFALALLAGMSPVAAAVSVLSLALLVVVVAMAVAPRATLRAVLRALIRSFYRIDIVGEEYLSTSGPVVFMSNHVSLLDGPLLFALIGRDCSFAVDTAWADKPFLKPFRRIVPLVPVNAVEPATMKGVAASIRAGGAAMIFPEGRLTVHGGLMKIFPGAAWLVEVADAPVVPINIEGLEFTPWSRRKTGFPRHLFPRVRLRVGPPRKLDFDPDLKGAERRDAAAVALVNLMERHRYEALDRFDTLPDALSDTIARFGSGGTIIADAMGNSLSRSRLRIGAAALGTELARHTEVEEHVGVLLPTVAAAPVVLFALWRERRVPALLNPTLGPGPALSCLTTAKIRKVVASRAFVDIAKLEPVIAAFEANGVEILWTEDLKAAVGRTEKLRAMVTASLPHRVGVTRDTPAVILFTSGTEGAPKAVVLSHGSLLANVAQLRARTDVGPADKMFSALPMFHSLGLTGGVLFPLICGARVALYPSPLHYREIPHMAYIHQPTIILGTDTFLSGWGRKASPEDFVTLRAAISGAEAVKPATRAYWAEKFGVRILEGYGTTEAAPVVALNTPASNKAGTVGRILPGIDTRLQEVPGLPGAKLLIKGANVMLGYYLPEAPGVLLPPENGWHDTGDLVDLDGHGFISIRGRQKRFVKVGGEMVSLGAVEALANEVWPGVALAAVGQPDPRKGECVVLAVTEPGLDRAALAQHARSKGVGEIALPARIVEIEELPVLASGKTNYPALTEMLSGEEAAA